MSQFVPGRFTAYPGTNFTQIFSTGEMTGVGCTGALRQGCVFSDKSYGTGYKERNICKELLEQLIMYTLAEYRGFNPADYRV